MTSFINSVKAGLAYEHARKEWGNKNGLTQRVGRAENEPNLNE